MEWVTIIIEYSLILCDHGSPYQTSVKLFHRNETFCVKNLSWINCSTQSNPVFLHICELCPTAVWTKHIQKGGRVDDNLPHTFAEIHSRDRPQQVSRQLLHRGPDILMIMTCVIISQLRLFTLLDSSVQWSHSLRLHAKCCLNPKERKYVQNQEN